MDPAVVAAIAAVLAALAGPVGIVIGWWLSRRSQNEGWSHEDRNRAYSERIEAFSVFLNAIDARLDWLMGSEQKQRAAGVMGLEMPWSEYEGDDPSKQLHTIAILSPGVEAFAQKLYGWTQRRALEQMQRSVTSVGPHTEPPEWARGAETDPWIDVTAYHALRDATIEAMQKNLGIPPERV